MREVATVMRDSTKSRNQENQQNVYFPNENISYIPRYKVSNWRSLSTFFF